VIFGRTKQRAAAEAHEDSGAWLVVGLGNPGREYERNRHNIGFRVADEIARRCEVRFDQRRAGGRLAIARREGIPVYLLKPQTYVNASGRAAGPVAHYYRVPVERILVICDDIDLPFGRMRIRAGGSSGGHNGLKSIIEALGNRQDFPRIRIGVGRPTHVREAVVGHVLENFSAEEEAALPALVTGAADAADVILAGDIDRAMDAYNRRPEDVPSRGAEGSLPPMEAH